MGLRSQNPIFYSCLSRGEGQIRWYKRSGRLGFYILTARKISVRTFENCAVPQGSIRHWKLPPWHFLRCFLRHHPRKRYCWEKGKGPYSVWRQHSVDWVKRLVEAINPKVVMVFGGRASRVFDIRWDKIERLHAQNHQTFGVSTFQGAPAVFCHHLSRSKDSEALKCFRYAKRLISERS